MKKSKRINDLLGNGIEEVMDPELKRSFEFDDNEIPNSVKKIENVRLSPDKFRVSGDGVFYTLQGEGSTIGMPTVFLRLHVCNLQCVWCDAYYTWNPKTIEFWTEGKNWSIDKTLKAVKKSWGAKNPKVQKRLVITGGEPLLQQKQIEQLMILLGFDWKIEIETNGTILPNDYLLRNCQFNCSPKLRNSQNAEVARKRKKVIEALSKANTLFKFVVMHNDDLDEIEKEWVDEFNIPVGKVCLMPQGVSEEEVQKNMRRVAEYAKKKGYRILPRLQVAIWGARRKV